MNMRCETVMICDDSDSFVIINKSDFDESIHELFEESEETNEPKEGTKGWLQNELTAKGIEFPDNAKKAELESLLNESAE